ncbi:hypothetical protein, partial [Treponema sp. OMZ 805]|uniref:hypothetical protein n=1 Tax=Treponema sp. OMZ 805 TaxID=2726068 RepID=UPI003D91DEF2
PFFIASSFMPINATTEQSVNFGRCCIRARKAHMSISKFSEENLTVNEAALFGCRSYTFS